jgi:hypothetical protein
MEIALQRSLVIRIAGMHIHSRTYGSGRYATLSVDDYVPDDRILCKRHHRLAQKKQGNCDDST